MKALVTAALPYANGDLHIGHLMSTYLPADVFARYCKLKGRKTLFVCATDEHGTPIEVNAARAGKPPREFVKHYRKKHAEDFKKAGVEFDVFYNTDSPENHALTKKFYEALEAKGLVYEKSVQQTYCPKCERFLPDRFVKGVCPECGAKDQYGDSCESCGKTYSTEELADPYCAVCKTPPGKKEASHKFFKLSARKEFLQNWFAENPALQKDVTNYLKSWLRDLKDWDITRDGPYFGVPLPDSENQFFYVWFDAPIGYVSSAQKWCADNGEKLGDWWSNASEITHFIGKDIIYHHYLFWPAMLEGAGYSLPKRIPTRGYLNMQQEKMSKSRGSFVLLSDILSRFPADYLRYHLTSITPNNTGDAGFSWKEFQSKVNNELIDSFGNLVYRVLSFVKTKYGGALPEPGEFTEEDKAFEAKTNALFEGLEKDFDAVELKRGLEKAMRFAGESNKYFNAREPWHLLKNSPEQAKTVLLLAAKAVYALSVALNPVLPFSTKQVFDSLGVEPKWNDFAQLKPGLKLNEVKPLYKKIEDEQIG